MQHTEEAADLSAADVITFASRDEWLAARRDGIGSSDAAAIFGLSRFKSPLALYYDKIGMTSDSPRAAEAAEWGLVLEEPIARRYAAVTGRHIAAPKPFSLARSRAIPFAQASVDRFIVGGAPKEGVARQTGIGVLEIKNAHYFMADQWSEDNNNEPPLEYQIQLQHQLMVTGLSWGSIAALIGGSLFLWADRPRDEDVITLIAKKEREFWERVQDRRPPDADGSESTRDILKKLYPTDSGEVISLGPDALDAHEKLTAAKANLKLAEADVDEASNRLRQLIGDATMASLPNGIVYTYKTQSRPEHTVKATSFRVLRCGKKQGK